MIIGQEDQSRVAKQKRLSRTPLPLKTSDQYDQYSVSLFTIAKSVGLAISEPRRESRHANYLTCLHMKQKINGFYTLKYKQFVNMSSKLCSLNAVVNGDSGRNKSQPREAILPERVQ